MEIGPAFIVFPSFAVSLQSLWLCRVRILRESSSAVTMATSAEASQGVQVVFQDDEEDKRRDRL